MDRKEYFAFISYQRKDEEWAKWLAHELEHYRFPVTLNGRKDLPKELRPIFRDIDELSAGNLPRQIHHALENSKHLIVICSPNSAKSEWVNKEIEEFVSMGKTDKIFPFIIEGKAFSEDDSEECFPPALKKLPKEDERLGGNINEMGRDAAVVKTVAGMLDLAFDTLWQRYEREKAEEERKIREQRDNLLCVQSRFLSEKAINLIEEDDYYTARLLCLEMLPKKINNPNRPYTIEGEIALRKSLTAENAILRGHSGEVNVAKFSPDGTCIASASVDKTIIIWDAQNGKLLKTLNGHTDSVIDINFSKDGLRLVSTSMDMSICIWDIKTGELIHRFEGQGFGANTACFNPDGKCILYSGWNNKVNIIDAQTGELLQSFSAECSQVYSACYSPDGVFVASASDDMKIRVWNVEKNELVHELIGHTGNYSAFATFSYDGRLIVSISVSDDTIRIWDILTGETVHILNCHGVESVAFTNDNRYLISTSGVRAICVWDLQLEEQIMILEGHSGHVNFVSFNECSRQIISASEDRTIRIWGIESNEIPLVLNEYDSEVNYLSFSLDGKYLISASRNNELKAFDLNSIRQLQKSEFQSFLSYENIKSRHRCFISSSERMVFIDDLYTGEIIDLLKDEMLSDIRFASLSPDEKSLVIVTKQRYNNLEIWDVSTGKRIRRFEGHIEQINSAFISNNSKYILSASLDKTVRIWDVESGSARILEGHTDYVLYAVFSPDEKIIASASKDCTIRLWDVKTGALIHVLEGHTKRVKSVAFSPTGERIASISYDSTIKIWDATKGVLLHSFETTKNHNLYNNPLLFSPDGQKIAAAIGCSIYIWDFPPLQALIDKTYEKFKNRTLMDEEKRKYYLD